MTTMLDEVLILGWAESGKLRLQPRPDHLEWFCGALINEFQLTAGDAYTLNLAFEGDCRTANLDENLLRHILTNLISNAIKHSPSGGIIDFIVTCDEGHAILRVADHGIGIPGLKDRPACLKRSIGPTTSATFRAPDWVSPSSSTRSIYIKAQSCLTVCPTAAPRSS